MASSHSSLTLIDNKPPALIGSCMCKKITYSSTFVPKGLTNCHCQTCRRVSGAPFLTFGEFPVSSITWTSGTSTLKKTSYSEIAERSHCTECGSPISMSYKCEPDIIYITAGTMDEDSIRGPLPKVMEHIFLEEKARMWYEIPVDEKVARYAKFSAAFQKKIEAWKELLKSPEFSGLG